MKSARVSAVLLVAAGLQCAAPGFLGAVEPERLPQKTFDVRVEGRTVEVTFALALSEVPSYPVAITAIGGSAEELLYEGMLDEGWYRVRAPLVRIGPGPLKVVVRTRVTNRTTQGPQSYIRYLTWEGSVDR